MEKNKASNEENDIRETREYHRVTENVSLSVFQERKTLLMEVFENRTSIRQAAIKAGLKNSTAKLIIRKEKKQRKSREVPRRKRQNVETQISPSVEENNIPLDPQQALFNFSTQNNVYPFYNVLSQTPLIYLYYF